LPIRAVDLAYARVVVEAQTAFTVDMFARLPICPGEDGQSWSLFVRGGSGAASEPVLARPLSSRYRALPRRMHGEPTVWQTCNVMSVSHSVALRTRGWLGALPCR
jgi:hypothetical protein